MVSIERAHHARAAADAITILQVPDKPAIARAGIGESRRSVLPIVGGAARCDAGPREPNLQRAAREPRGARSTTALYSGGAGVIGRLAAPRGL